MFVQVISMLFRLCMTSEKSIKGGSNYIWKSIGFVTGGNKGRRKEEEKLQSKRKEKLKGLYKIIFSH